MHCTICRGGRTRPGSTNIVLFRGTATIILKDVPAEVCGDCAEPMQAEPPGEAWGIGALARELAGGAGLKVRVARPGHGGLVSGVP